jgi:chromosome segregation ATPase
MAISLSPYGGPWKLVHSYIVTVDDYRLVKGMERTLYSLMVIMLVISLLAVPALAQKDPVLSQIDAKKQTAHALKNSMMTTDQTLAAQQEQADAVLAGSSLSDIAALKKDVARARSTVPVWEDTIRGLEKDRQDFERQSSVGQMSPATQSQVKKDMQDLRSTIDDLNNRLDSIKGRVDDLGRRVK